MFGYLSCFCCRLQTFSKLFFFQKFISGSNCFNPDQDHHSVGPDLGLNCLQRLSVDDKSHRLQEKLMVENNLMLKESPINV